MTWARLILLSAVAGGCASERNYASNYREVCLHLCGQLATCNKGTNLDACKASCGSSLYTTYQSEIEKYCTNPTEVIHALDDCAFSSCDLGAQSTCATNAKVNVCKGKGYRVAYSSWVGCHVYCIYQSTTCGLSGGDACEAQCDAQKAMYDQSDNTVDMQCKNAAQMFPAGFQCATVSCDNTTVQNCLNQVGSTCVQ